MKMSTGDSLSAFHLVTVIALMPERPAVVGNLKIFRTFWKELKTFSRDDFERD